MLDDDDRPAVLDDLWQELNHQGTVYECSPVAVPFLVALVTGGRLADRAAGEVALLLASITGATTFVVRSSGRPGGARDLADEIRLAAWGCVDELVRALGRSGPATRAGVVAVLTTVADRLGANDVAELRRWTESAETELAAAGWICLRLADPLNPLTADELGRAAAADPDAADYFADQRDQPTRVLAVEIAFDLCSVVVQG